jgi:hypothetical protein
VLRSQPPEPPARVVAPRLSAARRRSRRAGGAFAALAACAALAWAVALRSPATPPAEAVGSLSASQVPRFVHAEQHWGVSRAATPHPLSLEGMLLVVHARV